MFFPSYLVRVLGFGLLNVPFSSRKDPRGGLSAGRKGKALTGSSL